VCETAIWYFQCRHYQVLCFNHAVTETHSRTTQTQAQPGVRLSYVGTWISPDLRLLLIIGKENASVSELDTQLQQLPKAGCQCRWKVGTAVNPDKKDS